MIFFSNLGAVLMDSGSIITTTLLLFTNFFFFFLCEDDGAALQDALQELSGQRTVPNIFIKQQHIGGNSDLQAKKGQLDGLLRDAGAL